LLPIANFPFFLRWNKFWMTLMKCWRAVCAWKSTWDRKCCLASTHFAWIAFRAALNNFILMIRY
jgi:hypothetical protein